MGWREEWLEEYLGNAGCLGWFFGSAWGVAGLIYGPQQTYLDEDDQLMGWLYRLRSVLGIAVITFANVHYHRLGGIPLVYDAIAASFNWTFLFVLAAGIPAVAAVVWLTTPGRRLVALAQMRYPALALGGAVVTIYGMLWMFDGPPPGNEWVTGLALTLLRLAILLWLLPYLVHGAYLLAIGMFRLSDAHPLLAPVIAPAATWGLVIRDLATGPADTSAAGLMLLLGGPASVTALSVLEVLRLRQRYASEFPFRSGPQRYWHAAREPGLRTWLARYSRRFR